MNFEHIRRDEHCFLFEMTNKMSTNFIRVSNSAAILAVPRQTATYFNQLCNETNWLRAFEFQFSSKFHCTHRRLANGGGSHCENFFAKMIISHDTVQRAHRTYCVRSLPCILTLSQFNYPLFFMSKGIEKSAKSFALSHSSCRGIATLVLLLDLLHFYNTFKFI